MSRRRAVPLAIALLAGGCTTLEPAYRRPPAPTPATFPQGDAYAPAAAAPDPAKLPWREVFLDARLQAVIESALAENRDLRIAAANILAARAQYRVQRSARFPQVTATASALGVRQLGSSGESYGVDIGVSSFELDLFGRVRSLTNAAFQQYLATEEGARATRISLIAETASAWLTLAADRSFLEVASQTAATAEQAVNLTRSRLRGGISSQLEVSQAETIWEQARSDLAAFTTQVAQDRNALDLLVGAPVADEQLPAGVSDAVGFVTADVPAGLSSEVLLRRPDVLQAENQLRAASANIGAARANFFPRITLTGLLGLASPALGQLFSGGAFTYTAGPGVSLPIFTAGANRATLDFARAQQKAAVANYERAIQSAFRETADALARRGTIGEQLTALRRLTAASQTALELSSARYRVGSEAFLTVLDAQRSRYVAQQQLISALLVRETSIVSLYRALGGGLV